MRLALGTGVELDDGTLMRGAALESLVGAYPRGFALPTHTFRAASYALSRHATGWVAQRDRVAGMTLVQDKQGAGDMRANPEVLILEDDAETLDELQNHFTRKRFHPLGARSASRALSLLENNRYSSRPVLAIIDWDLGKAPDTARAAVMCCRDSARELRECPVIVYSQNIDAFNVRSQIQRSHPRALLHDKRDGDASLLERIDRMLDRSVGDLRIHDGTVVVHVPTLKQHHHREAIRLVVHHPDIVTFHSDTATKAVRRFGEWLLERGSTVRLVSHGNRKYRLSRDGDRGGLARQRNVNLSLAEITELPLAAALVDSPATSSRGRLSGTDPDPAPCRTPFAACASSSGRSPRLRSAIVADAVCSTAIDCRRELAERHAGPSACACSRCSLRLVAGRDPGGWGSTDDVIDHARAGITARTGLTVEASAGPARPVMGPEIAALVLVQLAVNAERHDAATAVRIEVDRTTFRVVWRHAGPAPRVTTARRRAERDRWGLGFARIAADAIGGTVYPPRATGDGALAATLELGIRRLALPLAAVSEGRVYRATRSWDEETGLAPGSAIGPDSKLATFAPRRHRYPDGSCVDAGFSARLGLRALWVAVPPDDSSRPCP